MNVTVLKELLKTEYGIYSESEFDKAVEEMPGVDLGIFTMPLKMEGNNSEQEDKTKTEIACC